MALVTDNACPNFDSDPSVSTLAFIVRCRATVRITDNTSVKTNVAEECAERELSFAWIMQCLLIPNPTGGAAFSRLRGMIGGHDLLPKLDLRQADSL